MAEFPNRKNIILFLKFNLAMSEEDVLELLGTMVFQIGVLLLQVQIIAENDVQSAQQLFKLWSFSPEGIKKKSYLAKLAYSSYDFLYYDRDFYALQCLAKILPGELFVEQLARAHNLEYDLMGVDLRERYVIDDSNLKKYYYFYRMLVLLQIDEIPMVNVASLHRHKFEAGNTLSNAI